MKIKNLYYVLSFVGDDQHGAGRLRSTSGGDHRSSGTDRGSRGDRSATLKYRRPKRPPSRCHRPNAAAAGWMKLMFRLWTVLLRSRKFKPARLISIPLHLLQMHFPAIQEAGLSTTQICGWLLWLQFQSCSVYGYQPF